MAYDLRQNVPFIGYSTYQIIANNNLPTVRQALSVLFYNMRRLSNSLDNGAKLVIEECSIFYKKARVPMQEFHNCVEKLKIEYQRWRNIKKSSSRNSATQKKNEADYQKRLDQLFDIAKANALQEMEDEDDKEFLRKQKGTQNNQTASNSVNKPDAVQENVYPMEIDETSVNAEKSEISTKAPSNSPSFDDTDFKSVAYEDNQILMEREVENSKGENNQPVDVTMNDEQVSVSRESRKRDFLEKATKDDLDTVLGPESQSQPSQHTPPLKRRATEMVMTPRLGIVLDKCKISQNNTMHLMMAAAEAFNVDTSNLILNTKSIHAARQKLRQERFEAIKILAPDLFSGFSTIHWDGKLLPALLRGEKDDRLTIVITSEGKEQLLGVPKIDSSTGKNQARAVYESLVDWCMAKNIEALCCDSTSSNTGAISGACTILEQLLGKNLLHFICRHHVYELELKCVFEVKFGKTTGPDVQQFKKFEDFWKVIDKNNYEAGIADEFINESLHDVKETILNFCLAQLKKDQTRKDYMEFLQLVVIFLGGNPTETIAFRPPGPVHHARWMAKAIYCLKIYLFRGQFLLNNEEDEVKYRDVCIFIVKVYVQAWFCATLPMQAPNQDLQFLKKLYDYKSIDKSISEATVKKFTNHLWYLRPELAALAFFDSTVSNEEKMKMYEALKSDCSTFAYKKRIIANEKNLNDIIKSNLSDFICKDSYNLFKRLKIEPTFLLKHPSKWDKERNYVLGLKIVKNLKVVNDAAEREVKLITDFNNLLTRDDQQMQYILPVIKEYKSLFSNSHKETLMKSYK